MMKRSLFALLILLMLTGAANAQSSSWGIRLGVPLLLSATYEYNFEAIDRGFSLRGFAGATFVPNTFIFGIGLEGLYRIPLDGFGSSVMLGAGLAGGILLIPNPSILIPDSPSGSSSLGFAGVTYLQLGISIAITPHINFTFDTQPVGFIINNAVQFYLLPVFHLGLTFRS